MFERGPPPAKCLAAQSLSPAAGSAASRAPMPMAPCGYYRVSKRQGVAGKAGMGWSMAPTRSSSKAPTVAALDPPSRTQSNMLYSNCPLKALPNSTTATYIPCMGLIPPRRRHLGWRRPSGTWRGWRPSTPPAPRCRSPVPSWRTPHRARRRIAPHRTASRRIASHRIQSISAGRGGAAERAEGLPSPSRPCHALPLSHSPALQLPLSYYSPALPLSRSPALPFHYTRPPATIQSL